MSIFFVAKLVFYCIIICSCIAFVFLISLGKPRDDRSYNDVKESSSADNLNEADHEARLKRVSAFCKRNSRDRTKIEDLNFSHLDHFIVDDENKLIYCYVPKVACTNWKRVLLTLRNQDTLNPLTIKGNETHAPNLFTSLSQLSKPEALYRLRNYLKFMFVRHPYERLLSAYRNKFENSYSNYFRIRFGRRIIKIFRPNATGDALRKGDDVTLREFLLYVTSLNRSNDRNAFNEHWRPIADLCFPCTVRFDIVGKYETLHVDADYALWKARLSNRVKFPRRDQTYNLKPSSELIFEYYANISGEVLNKVNEVYYDDLEMFGYSRTLN